MILIIRRNEQYRPMNIDCLEDGVKNLFTYFKLGSITILCYHNYIIKQYVVKYSSNGNDRKSKYLF